jgi:dTDP-4-dehydrorhamnose reductase
MRILVLGSNGQLGNCLRDQLIKTQYDVLYASRAEIDIGDLIQTKIKISSFKPDIVINVTAYTAVDNAEVDWKIADLINHVAVENIACICKELNSWLIHISTDYVFDGMANEPYREETKTNPQCVYGQSKLDGEIAIKRSDCKHVIIRTAWVFSEYGNNFLKTMLKLGSRQDELSVVGDQIGSPTCAHDLAKAIVVILGRLSAKDSTSGTFHYCGDQSCSWFEFAQCIFVEANTLGLKVPRYVNSIETSAYPTPALRPAYSVLECGQIKSYFGINRSDWHAGIKEVLFKLHCQR